jgi:hypothetical protein
VLAAWAAAAEALFVAPRDDAAGNAAALAALETLTAPLTHTNSFPKHVIADEPQPKRPKPVEDAASSTPMDVDAVKEAPAAAAPAAAAAEVLAPTLPDETKSQMSEYELAREAKIAANQQMLIELGIVDAKATISAAATLPSFLRRTAIVRGVRRSLLLSLPIPIKDEGNKRRGPAFAAS